VSSAALLNELLLAQDRVGGGRAAVAYDNELPAQQVALGPCSIAHNPVSNAGYLVFMDDAGCSTPSLWSDAGWQWYIDLHEQARPSSGFNAHPWQGYGHCRLGDTAAVTDGFF
jgi:formylglycine-generating enzyme required for sulfatase activity